jgi:hypothetical protein
VLCLLHIAGDEQAHEQRLPSMGSADSSASDNIARF